MTPSKPTIQFKFLMSALALSFTLSPHSVLEAQTWDGGGANGNTGNALNWEGDVLPAQTGASVTFTGSSQTTVNNDWLEELNGLTFADGAGSFSFGGDSIIFAAGGSRLFNESGVGQTVSANLSGSGSTSFIGQGTNSHTYLTGDLSGFGILTFTRLVNDGQLAEWTLSGNNSSGVVSIAAARVNITNASALGTSDLMLNSASAQLTNISGMALTVSNKIELRNRFNFMGQDDMAFTGGVFLHGSGTDFQFVPASGTKLTVSGDFVYRDDGSSRKDDPLRMSGAGTLEIDLSPVNVTPWVGGVLVTSGTLIMNSDFSSNTGITTISSGAVLAGDGILGGEAVISGSLRPGNSIGTLTVNDSVTWNGTVTNAWVFELGAANASDQLVIDGGQFLKGTGDDFVFDFDGSAATGTFTLIEWTSEDTLGGGTPGTNFNLADFSYTNLGGDLEGEFLFNDGALQFAIIPEPSAVAFLLAGMALAVVLSRRRG